MMNWWLERGADGFRMDVINLLCKTKGLPDASGPVDMNGYVFPTEHMSNVPPIHELLEEMAEKTYGDRDVFTVGECCAMPLEEGVKYTSGKKRQIDAVFSFEHIDMDAQPLGKWYYRRGSCRNSRKSSQSGRPGSETAGRPFLVKSGPAPRTLTLRYDRRALPRTVRKNARHDTAQSARHSVYLSGRGDRYGERAVDLGRSAQGR